MGVDTFLSMGSVVCKRGKAYVAIVVRDFDVFELCVQGLVALASDFYKFRGVTVGKSVGIGFEKDLGCNAGHPIKDVLADLCLQ